MCILQSLEHRREVRVKRSVISLNFKKICLFFSVLLQHKAMWKACSLKGLRAPLAVGKEGELQSASSDEGFGICNLNHQALLVSGYGDSCNHPTVSCQRTIKNVCCVCQLFKMFELVT